jgi:hypothetical protein
MKRRGPSNDDHGVDAEAAGYGRECTGATIMLTYSSAASGTCLIAGDVIHSRRAWVAWTSSAL